MLKVIWRSITGNLTRFALTALAIVLGVGFVAATYIYTDTTNAAFSQIFSEAFEGIDVQVAAETEFSFAAVPTFDESVVDDIAAVEGVATAVPNLQRGGVIFYDTDEAGEKVAVGGNAQASFGVHFPASLGNEFQGLRILDGGRPPTGPTEVVVDSGTADTLEVAVGDTVEIASQVTPLTEYTVVGILKFGELASLGNATFAGFDLPTAQQIAGVGNEVDGVTIFADEGVLADDLVPRVQSVLPEGVFAQSAQNAAEEASADVEEGLSFLTIFLNVFGFISLFVAAFLIANTFRIVVAQRTRELALMRALGASRRQVRTVVLGEAVATGVIASIIGIGLGLLIAIVLQRGLAAAGLDFPTTSLRLEPRTIVVALLIGVVVTLISAFLPARRASRIAPVQAMRESVGGGPRSLSRRIVTGSAIVALGVISLFAGLAGAGTNPIALVGLGAAVMMVGATVLAPVVAGSVTNVLGAPFRWLFKVTGRIAGENAKRSPRRTSATAGAIMIGVALVALSAVMVASIRGTVDELIDNGIQADLFIQPENAGFQLVSFTPELAERVEARDDVDDVATLRQSPAIIGGSEVFIAAFSSNFQDFFTLDELTGTFELSETGIAVDRGDADSNGWVLGDTVDVLFPSGGDMTFSIEAIYAGSGLSGFAVSEAALAAAEPEIGHAQVYVDLGEGVDLESAKVAIEEAAADVPVVEVLTLDDLRTSVEDQIGQILNIITALLAVAIIISLFGVTNTMTLSIFERTREIGLLRAVGMTRGQTRRMILSEASIISMFGALLGVGLGIFFGWALIRALADEGFTSFAIPWGTLAGWVIALGLLGVLFALWPARRAARLNVLEAIKYE